MSRDCKYTSKGKPLRRGGQGSVRSKGRDATRTLAKRLRCEHYITPCICTGPNLTCQRWLPTRVAPSSAQPSTREEGCSSCSGRGWWQASSSLQLLDLKQQRQRKQSRASVVDQIKASSRSQHPHNVACRPQIHNNSNGTASFDLPTPSASPRLLPPYSTQTHTHAPHRAHSCWSSLRRS